MPNQEVEDLVLSYGGGNTQATDLEMLATQPVSDQLWLSHLGAYVMLWDLKHSMILEYITDDMSEWHGRCTLQTNHYLFVHRNISLKKCFNCV